MQQLSSDKYQQQSNRPAHKGAQPLVWVIITVVIIGVGGFGMYSYLHHNNTNNVATSNTPVGGSNNPSTGGETSTTPPVVGTVTAFSSTSVTIRLSSDGSTKTFAITSATGGPPASSLQVGETIGIIVSTSDSSQASVLMPDYSSNGSRTSGSTD
jgi:hypothetical protein